MSRLELEIRDEMLNRRVPDNLLPMGLDAFLDPEFDAVYPLVVRSNEDALITVAIPAQRLRDLDLAPEEVFLVHIGSELWEFPAHTLAIEDALLSPPVRSVMSVGRLPPGRQDFAPRATASVLALIDAGIAFWNPDFARATGPAVERMSFLSYGELVGRLSAGNVQALTDFAGGPDGDARVRAELGALHPESVHAPFRDGPPAHPATRFSHGTAMLDVVLRNLPDTTRVIGVELPAEVVADASGGALEGVLVLAVDTAAQEMLALRDSLEQAIRGTVVLPYAFVGGPHDGSRASVKRLGDLIRSYRAASVELRLVVPMGNHLDDRVHARLARSGDGAMSNAVAWRLLPDDHSSNTVELLHKLEPQPHALRLACPDGDTVDIDLSRKGFSLLRRDGRPIGAIWTAERSGWMRTRISLAPTARRDGRLPIAPSGAWRLTLTEGAGLDAWILRDDATLASRALPPRRQSAFEDPAYRPMRGAAEPVTDDAGAPGAVVRREGTASLLATGAFTDGTTGIEAVGALWSRDGLAWRHAVYSGRHRAPGPGGAKVPEPRMEPVDSPRPGDGWRPPPEAGGRARGTAGPRRFGVSGTSVAAARRARDLAAEP